MRGAPQVGERSVWLAGGGGVVMGLDAPPWTFVICEGSPSGVWALSSYKLESESYRK